MNDIEASYASLDYALLGGFFISYSVFALIQLGFLFNQQYARFISLIAAQWATIAAIKSYSFAQLCTDRAVRSCATMMQAAWCLWRQYGLLCR